MKKILAIALMCVAMTTQAWAQDVLNDIVNKSYAIINDTTKDKKERQVAMFKYDALNYLRSRVIKPEDALGNNVDYTLLNAKIKTLNEQAYAMNSYISVYFLRLSECKKKNIGLVNYYFKHTTKDHPMFKEEDDTEYVEAYFNMDDFPVPFSLNCDWVKSLEAIRGFDWSDK